MFNHVYDRSFVAHVACITPMLEGYLNFAKLAEKDGRAAFTADDYMIITPVAGREPHRLWFRCMEDEHGMRYYDIQSWSRRTGRDFNTKVRNLELTNNGYAKLYKEPTATDRLWSVMTLQDDEFVSVGDDLAPGQHIEAQIWTPTNLALCGYGRTEVADQWMAYTVSHGGPVLDLRLEITDIGEELLDDH